MRYAYPELARRRATVEVSCNVREAVVLALWENHLICWILRPYLVNAIFQVERTTAKDTEIGCIHGVQLALLAKLKPLMSLGRQ